MADRATIDALIIGGLTLGLWAWLKSRASAVASAAAPLVQPASFTTKAPTTSGPSLISQTPSWAQSIINSITGQQPPPSLNDLWSVVPATDTVNALPQASEFFSSGAPLSGGGVDPEVDALARTIWGEARGEGQTGMEAVASVIMNRVRSARFPNTVQGVVYQPYQFSMWNAGDPNGAQARAVTSADPNFALALQIAQAAYEGRLADPTGGALHYAISTLTPAWASAATGSVTIGHHTFYTGVA